MKVLAEHGWFGLSLRHTCIMIGAGLLCVLGIEALFSPLLVREKHVFITWSMSFFMNALLTLAAAIHCKWLLPLWLVFTGLLIIGVPVTVIATVFGLGYYVYVKDTSHTMYVLYFEYAFTLFLYIYCGRFVLSYCLKLFYSKKIANPAETT